MNRRTFLRLLGLGATATAAGIVVAEAEPVRRWWAVPRNAPVPQRGHAFVEPFTTGVPVDRQALRAKALAEGNAVLFPSEESGPYYASGFDVGALRQPLRTGMYDETGRLRFDGAPLFPERAAEQARMAAGGAQPNTASGIDWFATRRVDPVYEFDADEYARLRAEVERTGDPAIGCRRLGGAIRVDLDGHTLTLRRSGQLRR